ncbi:MAG: flavodoxin family protein [bacterium]|nr:flavodoxin family protein [bacterium]
MKVYAINGSARKNGNTATLLQKALDGVKASTKNEEVEIEMINLYDLNFTGCKSCFACKMLEGKSYGKCIVKDDIQELLEKLSQADALIFGSPTYFGNISGQLQSFLERFLFPFEQYNKELTSLAPKKMPTAFIHTMNVPEAYVDAMGYKAAFAPTHMGIEHLISKPEVMYSYDTYQFSDYSKYESSYFSEEAKAAHRDTQFPLDCQKTYEPTMSCKSFRSFHLDSQKSLHQ